MEFFTFSVHRSLQKQNPKNHSTQIMGVVMLVLIFPKFISCIKIFNYRSRLEEKYTVAGKSKKTIFKIFIKVYNIWRIIRIISLKYLEILYSLHTSLMSYFGMINNETTQDIKLTSYCK